MSMHVLDQILYVASLVAIVLSLHAAYINLLFVFFSYATSSICFVILVTYSACCATLLHFIMLIIHQYAYVTHISPTSIYFEYRLLTGIPDEGRSFPAETLDLF